MVLGSQIRDLVDAFGDLLAQHLRLARLEFEEDARFVGVRLGLIAALAPMVFIGYGLGCIALALVLARIMPTDLAFGLVGAINLLVGAIGVAVVVRQLSQRKVMHDSQVEVEVSSSLIIPASKEPR